MSSGNLVSPSHPVYFQWDNDLEKSDYLIATYRVTATCDGDKAAIGMAMEQSAATLAIKDYVIPEMLADWTIRVCDVRALANDPMKGAGSGAIPAYFLQTEVYTEKKIKNNEWFEIELAVPRRLLGGKPAQLLNVLVGELPRLGFLTNFQLTDVAFPQAFGPGPSFGIDGVLDLLGMSEGPILCRSMRPAVGLDRSLMAELNRDVLIGGFHMVKDDELQYFSDDTHFERHVRCMVEARDEAIRKTGEPKLYLANLICEPDELLSRWDIVCELGVDAVMVAPLIQGMGVIPMLARQGKMPIHAHNTLSDLVTRHPDWRIDDCVIYKWYRHLGADLFVTPGDFASQHCDTLGYCDLINSVNLSDNKLLEMMPVIQGGKQPEGLNLYFDSLGTRNFMMVVASWVDAHPSGIVSAAREFRDAISL